MEAILSDLVHEFRRHKDLADRAISQLSDDDFFRKPGERSNSVAIIVKHLAGNLQSRWSDFLTTDGDQAVADVDRDATSRS